MANENTIAIPKSVFGKASEQKRQRTEDFISEYANNVSMSMSNWDMSLVFGRLKNVNVVEETIEILFSKELAKALTLIMTAHLQAYEAQFGEIKIDDLTKFQPAKELPTKEQQALASAARRKKK